MRERGREGGREGGSRTGTGRGRESPRRGREVFWEVCQQESQDSRHPRSQPLPQQREGKSEGHNPLPFVKTPNQVVLFCNGIQPPVKPSGMLRFGDVPTVRAPICQTLYLLYGHQSVRGCKFARVNKDRNYQR